MGKIALITGISGQDGSYLAELLISKKYFVHGICSHKKKINYDNLLNVKNKIKFHKIDINNYKQIKNIIKKIKPNEIYHLAAQSYVNYKFEDEFFRLNPNINGTHYLLASIKNYSPKSKFYFAASSEMFGNSTSRSQNEKTSFNPRSAYGISKVTGYYLTKNYREAYNLFSCSGILYNHESYRRGENFVTRKITKNLSLILKKKIKKIKLGSLDSKRDWGHAKDYVYAMWKMLQLKKPRDFVIGTGKTHTVRDFLKMAFKLMNLDYRKYFIKDNNLIRKNDKFVLKADIKLAKKILKWSPRTNFKEIVTEMVNFDCKNFDR